LRRKIIESLLDELFPHPEIPLLHEDPYTLLIATLLSAQCTDQRVNQVTPLLFAKAKKAKEMILLTPLEIQTIIRPCGLSKRKAESIWHLSKILSETYNGEVPNSFEALEALPGVGHKTASCVLSHAFHIATFPIDTHIHRIAKRWGLSSGKSVTQTETDLKQTFPKSKWNKLHLQMIYYARAYCPALRHKLASCPICQKLSPMASPHPSNQEKWPPVLKNHPY
jgi:endonuclease-3